MGTVGGCGLVRKFSVYTNGAYEPEMITNALSLDLGYCSDEQVLE